MEGDDGRGGGEGRGGEFADPEALGAPLGKECVAGGVVGGEEPTRFNHGSSHAEVVEAVGEFVEVVFGALGFALLAFGDADGHADGVAAVGDEFAVAFGHGGGDRV